MPDTYHFPPFQLDVANEQLWREGQPVPLRPKLFALLRYLVEHAGRLVSREELLQAVWPGTVVSESVLRGCIRALREALEDAAETPRFIETVARRGYRFLAPLSLSTPVVSGQLPVASKNQVENSPAQPATGSRQLATRSQQLTTDHWQLTTPLVGREAELRQLQGWGEKALRGERRMVFVTGEPGIGKTTVVEAFLQQLQETGDWRLETGPSSRQASSLQPLASSPWIGRGQCVEQYGAGEAYLPILEAVSRLGRAPGGERVVTLLNQYAPTWLVQLPALVGAAELEALQRRVAGATRERMLREAADVLEVLTAERPLVLVLEDLHWSDYATIDLLAMIARRREAARLLVLGTYRPADVVMSEHPLKAAKQELQMHGQCEELSLTFLTDAAVAQYLDARFPRHQFPSGLAQLIYRNTDGNPLFMVNTVDYLVHQGVVSEQDGHWRLRTQLDEVAVGVPENLRQLIDKQIERLSAEEREILEVASIVGSEFSAAVLAAGGLEVQAAESVCEHLVRRGQFLRARGVAEWPDGTVAACYGFIHALYQNVLYERIPAGRRVRLHQQIGAVLETGYRARMSEIATELATHFERGRDYRRAVQYRGQAAQTALHRSALHETLTHLHKALGLLAMLPDTLERGQQELSLQVTLGIASIAAKGLGAAEVEQAFARARTLSQHVEDSPHSFSIILGLGVFYFSRADFQTGLASAEQCLRLAEQGADPGLLLTAHQYVAVNLHALGELATARSHFERALQLYNPREHHSLASLTGFDPGLDAGVVSAWTLWHLGYPDQALSRSQWADTLARDLGHANTSAIVSAVHVICLILRGDLFAAQARAEEAMAFATEHGIPTFLAVSTACHGWLRVAQGQWEEGLAQMRSGLANYQATGSLVYTSEFLSLLADAYKKTGRIEDGFAALTEAFAFVEQTGERVYEAELYRLKGELTRQKFQVSGFRFQARKSPKSKITDPRPLTPGPQAEAEAEACFHTAIDIARRQQAKSLELRAVMSLARLWHRQGRTEEARRQLAEIYGWFTEGWSTADLLEAQGLLKDLSSGGSPHVP